MKIKKNTFSTLVLELLFPSIANCRKLKIQKIQKSTSPNGLTPKMIKMKFLNRKNVLTKKSSAQRFDYIRIVLLVEFK
jgi:hypothetical protein